MSLQITLTLLLFPEALLALTCHQCFTDLHGDCNGTVVECHHLCDSTTIIIDIGGARREVVSKDCEATEDCLAGRLNLGPMKMSFNSQCCSTDLCNVQKVAELPNALPNGKQCHACAGEECTDIVNCEGDEHYCINMMATVGGFKIHMKGCASESICNSDTKSMAETGLSASKSCCKGNLCNGSDGVNRSLFITLGALLSSILFL